MTRLPALPRPHRRVAPRALARGVTVLSLAVALGLTGACELRLGHGSPASLPQASVTEASRDALARQAELIRSTATVVSVSTTDQAVAQASAALGARASAQSTALGGVWQPWPTAVPSTYPTATPLASAAAGATVDDLVTVLMSGVTMATQSAVTAQDAGSARLFTSLAVSWSLGVEALRPGTVTDAGRDPQAMTEPLSGSLVLAYDAARYALEEVAARAQTGSDARTRATADAGEARQVVAASIAQGGDDTRRAAYAAPTAAADAATSLDVTWARQVWSDVMTAEVEGVAAAGAGSAARTAGVSAAVHAALKARAWGAEPGDLPGYDQP